MTEMMFDPLKNSARMEKLVVRDAMRRYYRTARGGSWYGGIASADCCGCNLRCIFCWSGFPRDHPESAGRFYSPEKIFNELDKCATKRGYSQLRISGNEPTIGKKHLLHLLELIDETDYTFILETNGILIGHERSYAEDISKFKCVYVRVSIKGTNHEEFSKLTGALPEGFDHQLKALENLLDAGVQCHAAVMLSFSTRENIEKMKEKLSEIDKRFVLDFEEEYVFLYPHVVERLKEAGIKPHFAYTLDKIPHD